MFDRVLNTPLKSVALLSQAEAYSEPHQTCTIRLFYEYSLSIKYIVKPLTIFAKNRVRNTPLVVVSCSVIMADHRSSHWRCSVEKSALKVLQNSQENTCTRVFLIKLQASTCNFIKQRLQHRSFFVNFANFQRTHFLQNFYTFFTLRITFNVNLNFFKRYEVYPNFRIFEYLRFTNTLVVMRGFSVIQNLFL